MLSFARWLIVLPLIWLLAGCASTPQTRTLLSNRPADLPSRVELTQVPFFAQDDYQCGPAALATALVHAGVDVMPQQLTSMIYLPARKGSLQPELLGATRRLGRVAYPLQPELAAVLREVAAGNPVLVLQNMRWKIWPQWHYAVVVGYDLPADQVVLRSGDHQRYTMSLSSFELSWAYGDYWGIAVMPPDRLPVTAQEQRYVPAVAAFERVSPELAERAYQTALARWPDSLGAHLGLGNLAYAHKNLAAAESAYRAAVTQHPQAADAWNNLAQVLHERGRKAEAVKAAERAVAVGGPHSEAYRQTLQEVGGAAP